MTAPAAPETLIGAAGRVYAVLSDASSKLFDQRQGATTESVNDAALWAATQGALLAVMALPATCASDARAQIEALMVVHERGELNDPLGNLVQDICAANAEQSIRAFLIRTGGAEGAEIHPGGDPFLVPVKGGRQ